MLASLKSTLGLPRGIQKLESKILDLQNKHQQLLAQRQQNIASFITALNLAHIDDQTLIGGLLFLKDKITTQDPMVEGWHHTGDRFLRRTKSKTCPRVPSGEHLAPKASATAHATPQSSQKRS